MKNKLKQDALTGKSTKKMPTKEKKEIWDCCLERGKELTTDMVEDKDWFCVRNGPESFPLCRDCYDI